MRVVLNRWLSFFGLLISFVANSQNLVQNGNFTQIISCIALDDNLSNYIAYWYVPTQGSPDFFDSCFNSPSIKVPLNFMGYQESQISEGGYLGIVCKAPTTSNYREYVSSKLSSPLIANRKYVITFYVSLADSSQIAIDKVGMYLSVDSVYAKMDTDFVFIPQVGYSGTVISDTLNWTKISDTIIAIGGEQFITIGNFYTDLQTMTKTVRYSSNLGTNLAYYYIDEVSVTLVSGEAIQEFSNPLSFSVFPNPARTNLTIQTSLSEHPVSISLFNLLGQNVSVSSPPVSPSYSVDVGDLPKGVYIVQVQDLRNGAVGRQKIAVE